MVGTIRARAVVGDCKTERLIEAGFWALLAVVALAVGVSAGVAGANPALSASSGSPAVAEHDVTVGQTGWIENGMTDRQGVGQLAGIDPGPTAAGETPATPIGDANQNGAVDIGDAQAIAQNAVGNPPPGFDAFLANVTRGSGGPDIGDAQVIANYEVGAIDAPDTEILSFTPATNISVGDTVNDTVTVRNIGGLGAVQAVTYRVAETDSFDNVLYEQSVDAVDLAPAIFPGNTTESSFGVEPDLPAGTYVQGLFSEGPVPDGASNASATAPLTVDSGTYAGGNGTAENPYQIATWTHLDNVRENPGAQFVLLDSLDANTPGYGDVVGADSGFEPIGDLGGPRPPFTGVFDGDGHTIADLEINRSVAPGVGLFGSVGPGGILERLGVERAAVTGGDVVGGLVGLNNGTVRESYVTGNVTGVQSVGGLAGVNLGEIRQSYSTAAVRAGDANVTQAGGLAGVHLGLIAESYATGAVPGEGLVTPTGGLVGTTGSPGESVPAIETAISDVTPPGQVVDSYWNGETTGQILAAGDTVLSGDNATALTTAEMRGDTALGTMVAFDFNTTWAVVDTPDNESYPVLTATPQEPAPGLGPPGDSPAALYAGGNGTAQDPYRIANWTHLDNVRESPFSAFVLVTDLDEATPGYDDAVGGATGFAPIPRTAGDGPGDPLPRFTGTFDGDGHTIADLLINLSTSGVGLFSGIGPGGTVERLGVENATVSGNNNVGALAGIAEGTVGKSYTTGTVEGAQFVGGLLGGSGYTVQQSYSTAAVSGQLFAGGLSGLHFGLITESYAAGPVSAVEASSAGGLVGAASVPQGTARPDTALFRAVETAERYHTTDEDPLPPEPPGVVTSSYWDTETTGQDTSPGNATGLATGAMRGDGALEFMSEFDFGGTWAVVDTPDNESYPFLTANAQTPRPGLGPPVDPPEESPENPYAGGNGTAQDPYLIANWTHLDNVRKNLDAQFLLSNDLDGTTAGYAEVASPVANSGSGFDPLGNETVPFTGVFDGGDHSVVGLTVERPATNRTALVASNNGLVRNVTVAGAVRGDGAVGLLVGYNEGTVFGSSALGAATGNTDVGGLVGRHHDGVVDESGANVTVAASPDPGIKLYLGGLVGGVDSGEVRNSHSAGLVSGFEYIGGLVGGLRAPGATVERSSSSAEVNGGYKAGGLVGFLGLQGGTSGAVSIVESYATGPVSGDGNIGGLVGANYDGNVTRSYATGSVDGSTDVGGLVGLNGLGSPATIAESYAVGPVSGTDAGSTGGLIGENNALVTSSYWDEASTGQNSSAGGTALVTSEMRGQGALDNMAGFDFGGTWAVVDTPDNESYPFLAANAQTPPPGLCAPSDPPEEPPEGPYAGGNGTAANPYQIATWTHLDNVRLNLGAQFVLVNHLDETTAGYAEVASPNANGGAGFDPIGSGGAPFTGVFDGNESDITGLYIDRETEQGVGLFGHTDGATVGGVGLLETSVTGDLRVGGLVGANAGGTIQDSHVAGTVTGAEFVGGLVGSNGGDINGTHSAADVTADRAVGGLVGSNNGTDSAVTNAHATGDVTGELNGSSFNGGVGGLVGINNGTVTAAHAAGEVTGQNRVGGLIGQNTGPITESNATGNVTATSRVGGLVGMTFFGSDIGSSHATGNVTASESSVGGLVGNQYDGAIADSYATGSVTGEFRVGGLVGGNEGTVQRSYATGTASGNEYVGGLVGRNYYADLTASYATGEVTGTNRVGGLLGENFYGTVTEAYATGNVTGSGERVGGLVGWNIDATVTAGYWNTQTTGQNASDGSPGGNGLTTAQMRGQSAVGNMTGFDFNGTWAVVDTPEGESYPFLTATPQTPPPGLGASRHRPR